MTRTRTDRTKNVSVGGGKRNGKWEDGNSFGAIICDCCLVFCSDLISILLLLFGCVIVESSSSSSPSSSFRTKSNYDFQSGHTPPHEHMK